MSGGAASGQTGARYERELVDRFKAAGWGALRLGASGSGGDADLPDVLAGHPVFHHYGGAIEGFTGHPEPPIVREELPPERVKSDLFAIELKSGKATTLYVEQPEVDALRSFARTWGARPFLGARFTTQGSGTETWLVAPEDARGPTDAGRYGLPVADVAERASVAVSDDGVERLG